MRKVWSVVSFNLLASPREDHCADLKEHCHFMGGKPHFRMKLELYLFPGLPNGHSWGVGVGIPLIPSMGDRVCRGVW